MNTQNDTGFSLYGILFYTNSKLCEFCTPLRNVIFSNGLSHYIQEMCIDTMSEEQYAQWGLTVVPTLIVIYENKMQGIKNKTIFIGREVSDWVEQRVLQKREMLKNTSETTRQNIINENIMNKKKDNIHDYNPLETGGQSDMYSYWFNDMNKDTGQAHPKNYLPYGQDENYSIATINEKNSHKNKIGERETKDLIVQMEKSRNQQNDTIVKNNELNRLMAAKKKLGML